MPFTFRRQLACCDYGANNLFQTTKKVRRSPSFSLCVATLVVSGLLGTFMSCKIAATRNYSVQQCDTHESFCARKALLSPKTFRVAPVSPQSNALLAHMVSSWCNERVYQLCQQRNLEPRVWDSGAQRTEFTHWVCAKYTGSVVYTSFARTGTFCMCIVHCHGSVSLQKILSEH